MRRTLMAALAVVATTVVAITLTRGSAESAPVTGIGRYRVVTGYEQSTAPTKGLNSPQHTFIKIDTVTGETWLFANTMYVGDGEVWMNNRSWIKITEPGDK